MYYLQTMPQWKSSFCILLVPRNTSVHHAQLWLVSTNPELPKIAILNSSSSLSQNQALNERDITYLLLLQPPPRLSLKLRVKMKIVRTQGALLSNECSNINSEWFPWRFVSRQYMWSDYVHDISIGLPTIVKMRSVAVPRSSVFYNIYAF